MSNFEWGMPRYAKYAKMSLSVCGTFFAEIVV